MNYAASLDSSIGYASIILSKIHFKLLDRQNVNVAGHVLSMSIKPRRAGLNSFAGRIWPAGRTLPITGLDEGMRWIIVGRLDGGAVPN